MKKVLKKIFNLFKSENKMSQKEKRHSLVGQAHLWKMKQQFQIHFLKSRGLNKTNVFLDIGCGTLRGGIPIITYLDEEKYYGIDVRREVIEEAHQELEQENLTFKKPQILCFSEFSELQFNLKFDVIFAFAVLIHLSDDILNSCLKFVGENLAEQGVFYANVNVIEKHDDDWQGFPVVFRSLEFYKKTADKYGLKIEVISTLRELGHVTNKLGDEQLMLKITIK
ncbi:MAG: hypothetical protein CMC55_01210 [Flavobacteriaceae bacterium]|uniref:class I SAM-dependent methyltransferase n=1 Tax=Bizionia echini TaxID=649333 RepID=UPI000C91E3ED|nr:hypothetical protein [Flavobacteriaceae bacterium]